jgi:death-on-curing protein
MVLRGDLFDVAASYAFHIAEAQAFIDGNKRTAILSAIVFLAENGFRCHKADDALYDAMIAIAQKRLDKKGLAAPFRKLAQNL